MGMPLPWVWSWDPPALIGIVLAAALYIVGVRSAPRPAQTRAISRLRILAYALGLLAILVALQSPIAAWSDLYLTAHMLQNILLIFVAAPLLVLSAPLLPFWHALPSEVRRDGLRWGLRHPHPRRASIAAGDLLSRPGVVLVLFVGDFLAWHAPLLFDLALNQQAVYDLEHLCYLGTALLFWTQLIASPPLHPRMNYGSCALYLFGSTMALLVVALAFMFSPTPIYSHYAALHIAGGPGATVDQTAAGGLMNLMLGVIFTVTFSVLLWKWLESEEENASPLPPPGLKVRPVVPPIQPTFKGKPLRWTPIVLEGGAARRTQPPTPEDEEVAKDTAGEHLAPADLA